jgi:hypothetical protein
VQRHVAGRFSQREPHDCAVKQATPLAFIVVVLTTTATAAAASFLALFVFFFRCWLRTTASVVALL